MTTTAERIDRLYSEVTKMMRLHAAVRNATNASAKRRRAVRLARYTVRVGERLGTHQPGGRRTQVAIAARRLAA